MLHNSRTLSTDSPLLHINNLPMHRSDQIGRTFHRPDFLDNSPSDHFHWNHSRLLHSMAGHSGLSVVHRDHDQENRHSLCGGQLGPVEHIPSHRSLFRSFVEHRLLLVLPSLHDCLQLCDLVLQCQGIPWLFLDANPDLSLLGLQIPPGLDIPGSLHPGHNLGGPADPGLHCSQSPVHAARRKLLKNPPIGTILSDVLCGLLRASGQIHQ